MHGRGCHPIWDVSTSARLSCTRLQGGLSATLALNQLGRCRATPLPSRAIKGTFFLSLDRVGQNIALHASPVDRTCLYPPRLPGFYLSLFVQLHFPHKLLQSLKVACIIHGESEFYIYCGSNNLYFAALILPLRLTGRKTVVSVYLLYLLR